MLAKEKLVESLETIFSETKRNGDNVELEDVPSFDILCETLTEICGGENGGYFSPTDIYVEGIDHDWSVCFKHRGNEYCVSGTMRYGYAHINKYGKSGQAA